MGGGGGADVHQSRDLSRLPRGRLQEVLDPHLSIGLRETRPHSQADIRLLAQHFILNLKTDSPRKWPHTKKEIHLSAVPFQPLRTVLSIFITVASNHLSHQSGPFHPCVLKFFSEAEAHCNLITASPRELST